MDSAVLGGAVPGFAVQHLVENAIRHGIARRPDAGRLVVAARRDGDILELTVSDDGPGIAEPAEGPPGHGIANTRDRLRALYGDRASCVVRRGEAGGTEAILRIPWRELLVESDVAEG